MESSMEKLDFLPQESVIWGRRVLPAAIAEFGKYGIERPIVFSVEPLDHLRKTYLNSSVVGSVGTFLDFPPHVPEAAVRRALDACVGAGARSIIALGGGSVIDAAKAVSHFHQAEAGGYLPIAALPTTLSGSEFSHYFGVTETASGTKFKRSYAVRHTTPKVVVLDPDLVRGTPRALLLSSAIKGIDHAVEGMRQVSVEHPHALIASRGARRFLDVLRKWPAGLETEAALLASLVKPEDLLELQLAAWQSYFFPASVIYGLSHRIGHVLGGTFGLPHSMTSCVTLAPVIEACGAFYGGKLVPFARQGPPGTAALDLATEIAATVKRLELPSRLREFDFQHGELAAVAELLCENYPKEVADLGGDSAAKLRALLERLW
jgi:alcohol dehydrogenase class IV